MWKKYLWLKFFSYYSAYSYFSLFPPHPSPPPLPVPPDPASFLAVLYAVPLFHVAKPLLTPSPLHTTWLKQEATEMSKHRWVWSLNLYVCWQPNNLQEVMRGNAWCAGLVYTGRFYFHLDKFVETCHNTQASTQLHVTITSFHKPAL